ncbi:MAG TPA: SUMF1/EgtB/PvdO family nonheme iron enzyme, partial [Thermoanaerobaculia bacterium]
MDLRRMRRRLSAAPAGLTLLLLLSVAASPPPKAPPGMRWIPPGEFTMGTDSGQSMVNERPAHRVRLDGFWIDETP